MNDIGSLAPIILCGFGQNEAPLSIGIAEDCLIGNCGRKEFDGIGNSYAIISFYFLDFGRNNWQAKCHILEKLQRRCRVGYVVALKGQQRNIEPDRNLGESTIVNRREDMNI